ncbi:MAG: PCMD domain-containing protein [Muribaculaceae bacterium]|nr:PCMD domain-containing protein [Muribaculaceae bacterium]
MKRHISLLIALAISLSSFAQSIEKIRYGDFENWITRHIPESKLLGGKTKTVYEIGPTQTIEGAVAYTNKGGSPWATSNVYARVMGINKASNAVVPDTHDGKGRCCRMSTILEPCKVLGMMNMEVLVSGSIFLGRMFEPITSTKSPYSKMEMGISFTKRPKSLQYDYRVVVPANAQKIHSSGFGKKKTLNGKDYAEVFLFLQRRWEDADGNIYANRVGTIRERFGASTTGWVNGHVADVIYGDATKSPKYKSYMGLIPEDRSYYARNSKGKMVPVKEVGWDTPDATPTHMILMASSGSGVAYEGVVGMNLWVDNFYLRY